MLERDVELATPQVGDNVVMPVTGAYCYSLSNNYNGARRPPVVLCHEGERPLGRAPRGDERPAGTVRMTPHPLDPLSADEIRQAAAILRRDRGVTDRWRFASIELREPREERGPLSGGAPRDLLEPRRRAGLQGARLAHRRRRRDAGTRSHDGQPNMTVDEFHECDEALRSDPRVIAALADRGITDMDRVLIDTWAYGAHLVPEQHRGGRIGWADVWYRKEPGSSPYANPVTGLHFVVDLNKMELLEIEDTHRVDEPSTMGEYAPHLVPGLRQRDDVRPLEITQPDGTSFTLDGNAVTWQKWTLRVGFNHREGMVLHTVAYDGRSVAHRLSFAEMVVPYRDPTTDHYRRTAFDIGEWGLGFMTTSLELGCDCLGEIAYLDAVMHDTKGEPYTIRNAICIHEEDDAILWKHVDAETGAETRRARRLVRVVPRDGRQLRVPRLLALLPGRQHRVRRAGDRDHGHHPLRRGRTAAVRHAGRRAHLRPVPPALPRRPARPRRRRRGQHGVHDRVRGAADRPGKRARPRARAAQHAAAERAGGQAGLRVEHPARLEGGQRRT